MHHHHKPPRPHQPRKLPAPPARPLPPLAAPPQHPLLRPPERAHHRPVRPVRHRLWLCLRDGVGVRVGLAAQSAGGALGLLLDCGGWGGEQRRCFSFCSGSVEGGGVVFDGVGDEVGAGVVVVVGPAGLDVEGDVGPEGEEEEPEEDVVVADPVELERRGVRVLKDKGAASFKTAMKADLVIVGSAVSSSWIEPYLVHNTAGSGQIVWWIMENRREYFDRSKHLLNRVKMLMFLTDSQSKQWSAWCEEEHIKLTSEPILVPLSVNDELAFVAGIPCSLNTAVFSPEKMVEKREMLRSAVRKEMGLDDSDMVVMSLSSINPAKGQRFLVESALLVAEHNVSLKDPKSYGILEEEELSKVPRNQTILNADLSTGIVLQKTNQSEKIVDGVHQSNGTSMASKKKKKKKKKPIPRLTDLLSFKRKKSVIEGDGQKLRSLLSERESKQERNLKVLIGSIGSKSNKVLYVKTVLRFISQHSNLSKSILWTPTTTRVASLYAAADAYVINAQGLGETFGRVTIEAMAFGLPILGTDAGGTKEIVTHGVSGLLHPTGHEGVVTLAENIQFLLSNQTMRKKMGTRGRLKVQNMYLKHHMYGRFAAVLAKSLKPK